MTMLSVRGKLRTWLGSCLLSLVLGSVPEGSADTLALPFEVPVGSWRELPGTKLKDAWASWGQPESLPGGSLSGASAIINAWNSGALDTKRGMFVIPRTGGHADWAGNQVVGFDLSVLKWRLLRSPSANYPRLIPSNPGSTYINPYSDGTPASVHTYDAVEYLPTVDRIWSAGGIYWSPGGESAPPKTWWWNPTSTEWEAKTTRPGGYGTSSRWVGFMERLLVRTGAGLYSYDPKGDSYAELFRSALPGSPSTMAVDEGQRKVHRFVNGKLSVIDLRNPGAKESLLDVSGETSFLRLSGIAVIFDRGKLIAFGLAPDADRGAVFVIDPATRVATRHSPPDDTQPPRPTSQGVWKRFFEYRGYYWAITQWNDNVWVFNPGPTGLTQSRVVVPSSRWSEAGQAPLPVSPAGAESTRTDERPPRVSVPTPMLTQARSQVPVSSQSVGATPLAGLQPRTWTPIPAGPMGYTSKHTRLIHDSRRGRMVLAGGDGTGPEGDSYTGQNVFAIDLAQSATWMTLHGFCAPPGGVQPSRPDNVTWVYDPKRDQAVVMPAYYGATPTKCPGIVDDPVKRPYTFDFVANRWALSPIPSPVGGWGGDLHNHFGVLDPVTDAVYRFHLSCGMQIVPLDGTTGACHRLSFSGRAVSNMWNLSNDQPAIDVQGRAIYAISRVLKAIVKWSITDKKVVELIPLPPAWVAPGGEFGGWEYETYLAFDSKNRVLLHPNTSGYGGVSKSPLGLYHVDTKRWESEPVPPEVTGNTLGYDATNDVFLFLGRNAAKSFWLYRY